MRPSSEEITDRVHLDQARNRQIGEGLGIDATSFEVLRFLAHEMEPIPIGKIRKYLDLSKFKASRSVHALEGRGYASTWSPLEDHRVVLAAVSTYGLETLDHFRSRAVSTSDRDTDWWDAFKQAVGKSDVGSLCEARVLILICEHEDLAVREIFMGLDLPQSTVSVALRRLLARGLISCQLRADGRRRVYAVTDAGRHNVEKTLDCADRQRR